MQSMTGYGRYTIANDGRRLVIELKSVNHRFLDIAFRMPRSFAFMEDAARKRLGEAIKRGHVDVFASYANLRSDAKLVEPDRALINGYMNALDEVKALTGLEDDRTLSTLARFNDIFSVSEAEDDQAALQALMAEALDGALDALKSMRAREGEALKADLSNRLSRLSEICAEIENVYPATLDDYRTRLTARLTELLGGAADETRLITEAAIVAERSAIDEELVRLESHVSQLTAMLGETEPIGRKLDFIVQEMNREINTIGSKAQSLTITNLVVDAKSELEKLREQVQNVE